MEVKITAQESQSVGLIVTKKQPIAYLKKEELIPKITSSNLSRVEKEIALASIEKWVKDYSDEELTVLLTGLIDKTHANCGQKEDNELIDMTIDEFVSDLKKYNTTISFQEIQLAFTNGYKGVYGEWFGLNNKTYFNWINAFTWSVERKRAKELTKPISIEKKLSDEEKIKIIHYGCLKLFEDFKAKFSEDKDFSIVDTGNVNYNYLSKLGVIDYPEKRRSEFKAQAQIRLRHEALEAKNNAKGVFAIRQALEKIEELNDVNSKNIVTEAKRIALNTFFKDLVDMGESLGDLINEK